MDKEKKRVIGNSLFYSLSNILLKMFSFFLIPLYTAYLSTEQYGVINLANGFVSFVSCIVMCGLQYAVIRYYADVRGDDRNVRNLISTVVNFLVLLCVAVGLLLLVSIHLWEGIVFKNIHQYSVVILSVLISCTTGLYFVYQEILKGMQNAKKSIRLTYLYFFLLLGCNILTIVVLRMGATGVLVSNLIVVGLMIAIMFYDLIKSRLYIPFIDSRLLKSLLRYSLPLVPHAIAFNISGLYSRIIINSKLSTSLLGLYSLASQFGAIADQLSNSVQSAFQPWLFQQLRRIEKGENCDKADIRSLTDLLLWIYGGVYVVIGGWCQEIITVFTSNSYHSAWTYVPVFIMSVAIKSPLYFYQNFMYFHKRLSGYIFICTVLGCTISMILVWLWVPEIGIFGAILADIVALSVRLVITRWILRNVDTIYSFVRVMGITFVSIVWVGLTVFPSYLGIFHNVGLLTAYKAFMTVLYLLVFLFVYRSTIYRYIKLGKINS